ncbi:MAG: C40 family peptidase [Candidatus Zipacnadales bacterium]
MKSGTFAPLVIGIMLGSLSSFAAAKVFPGWVIPEVLNVRSGPAENRPIIGQVRRGDKVYVTAFVDGWCYAKLPDGRRGYVMEKFVQFSAAEGKKLEAAASRSDQSVSTSPAPVSEATHPAWIKVEQAQIRSGPGTNYSSYGTRPLGTKVFVVGRQGDWAKVKTPGGFGWIRADLLTDHVPTGQQLAAEAGQPTSSNNGTVTEDTHPAWIKVEEARIRSGPGLNYKIYGTRSQGTKVFVVDRQGDWAKVKTPGGYGWILAELLTDHVPTGQQLAASRQPNDAGAVAKAFASGDRLYLRAGPGTRYDYRAVLRKGQTLYVTDKKGDWVKVRVHGGHEGWVYADYVKYAEGSSARGSKATPPPTMADFPSPTRQYTGGFSLTEMPAWTDTRANVRYGPGVDYDTKVVLDRGTQVTVTDINGHWCKVRLPDGSYGWMAGYVLDYDGPSSEITATEGGETVEVKVGWIARTDVNLRAGPGMDASVIGKAKLSTQVVILDQQGDWYKVGLDGGKEAWVHSGLVDTREQRQLRVARRDHVSGVRSATGAYLSRTLEGSGLGAEIVCDAMNYLGSPYRYAHSGEGGAFDCSGFTSFLYRKQGINISRSCAQQFRQGTPVSRSELQPGDCVFFRGTSRSGISHVGIYIGNGEFIHASNPRSGVKIDRLDSSYYAPRYAGARRMR